MKRKKEVIIILASIVVIILSVSVAYFTTKIISKNRKVTVTSSELKMVFTSGTGQINSSSITPGWTSGENTFTVTNESKKEYTYNLIIKDYINTTVTTGFLVYKITSTDGGYNMTNFIDMPKSATAANTTLAENIPISAKATHTYKIEIKYLDSSTVSQDEDQGKKLSGTIFIDGVKEASSQNPTLASKLLKDNPTIGTRSDFSTPFTTNTVNTLYKASENATDVYYFAGQDTANTPVNNWVKFGKFYWRIIRTNADGSIRLLYSGTSPDTTAGYIGKSAFNTDTDSPKSAGYMYGDDDSTLDGIRANTNDSTIKAYIDTWYENNLTSYTEYLSKDAIYCNDRELAADETYSTDSIFNFRTYERITSSIPTPLLNCHNTKDAFSGNNTKAKLKYPIALMTADEIAYAGGVYEQYAPMWYYSNSTYSSITNLYDWWSLSQYDYSTLSSTFVVYGGEDYGYLEGHPNDGNYAVRPVTSLKSCVQWKSGNGSATSPYEIVENGGC